MKPLLKALLDEVERLRRTVEETERRELEALRERDKARAEAERWKHLLDAVDRARIKEKQRADELQARLEADHEAPLRAAQAEAAYWKDLYESMAADYKGLREDARLAQQERDLARAEAAVLREALERTIDGLEKLGRDNEEIRKAAERARDAVRSLNAGRDLLERLRALERVAAVAREVYRLARFVDRPSPSDEGLSVVWHEIMRLGKELAALAALDGQGCGEVCSDG